MTLGLVLTGRNNIFTVRTADGEFSCRLKGKRLDVEERGHNPLAPGDIVGLSRIEPTHRTAIIDSREPRRAALIRFNRKRNAPQTLAANVDRAFAVASVHEPDFRPRFVDRFLALAEHQGLEAGIIVTKADLDRHAAESVASGYARLGYPAIVVAADSSDDIDRVREAMLGRLSVLVGQSGVGKSTLVNALMGAPVQTVGRVSHRYLKGRHTTNAARLIEGNGLRIVDTPGIRELDIRTIDLSELAWCFVEFRSYLGSCGHTDCLHTGEPGCAVAAAVAAGAIAAERYASYRRLADELDEVERGDQ